MTLFLQVLAAIFIAEMGDKTQLLMIAMTAKYKLRDILIGSLASIAALNAIAVVIGSLISELIPIWLIKLIAGIAFFYFAWSTFYKILKNGSKEEDVKHGAKVPAILAVFGTFFIAELGDKTQLAALAFSASSGFRAALIVWGAATIGLFAADVIGILVIHLLKKKIPDNIINIIAAVIFAVVGFFTVKEGMEYLSDSAQVCYAASFGVLIIFIAVSLVTYLISARCS